jgi:hypothetical protein
MTFQHIPQRLQSAARSAIFWLAIAVLALTAVLPAMVPDKAQAAQLSSRKVTISNSKINATDVEFAFSYTIGNTSSTKGGIIYQFCTTPLGTCTLPAGMSVQSATNDAQSGWSNLPGSPFTAHIVSDEGDCTMATNSYMMCFERDETVATGFTGGAVTHTISGITAPNTIQSVYVRISLYTDDDFGSGDRVQSGGTNDEGVVAAAFVDQLTVTGRVQERLDFCMAAIDDDDALPGDVGTCSALSDSGIDIGTIDNTSIAKAPVEPTATNGADDDYGIAMVNTNASGGVVVAYYADAATNVTGGDTDELRAFRVLPTDCTVGGASTTDQCFISADNDADGEIIAAGTERFGMQVACIDGSQGTTDNLGSVPDKYNNVDNDTTEVADCQKHSGAGSDAGNQFAWNDSATAETVASSATVVDDEIIKLRFAATANATTPTGSYLVLSVFIATPTF